MASPLPAPIFTISPSGPIKINDTITFSCSMNTQTDFWSVEIIRVHIGIFPNQTGRKEINLLFKKSSQYYSDQIPQNQIITTSTGIVFTQKVPLLLNQNALCKMYRISPESVNSRFINLTLWSEYNLFISIIYYLIITLLYK